MIFELAHDFHDAVVAMPTDHPNNRMLELLEEAIRRDIHFINRHPTTLFQCMWNTCWWYDCPEADKHYIEHESDRCASPPWKRSGPKLHELLESWRCVSEHIKSSVRWLRSLRPPALHLGTAQKAVFRGHEDAVNSVAFSPDGQRIVSGSSDKTLRIWDTESSIELAVLRGHEDSVNSVAFSPDGQRIISGSSDETLRIWDAENGEQIICLFGHEDRINSVAFSPDGRKIASGGHEFSGGKVRIWDAESGEQLQCNCGHRGEITCVVFSQDGKRIASAGGLYDRTIRIWDVESGAEKHCFVGHEETQYGGVESIVFSRDSRWIVSGGEDKTVRIWDVETGNELQCLQGHLTPIVSIACSPDGKRIASASGFSMNLGRLEHTVHIWDVNKGQQLRCMHGHESYVKTVAWSPDGQLIASGSADGSVRVWGATFSEEINHLHDHIGQVRCITFSGDGRRIVSGSDDRTVRVWDTESAMELRCLPERGKRVVSVACSVDGTRIASAHWDHTVRIWDTQIGIELHKISYHSCWKVVYSADSRLVLACGRKSIMVLDAESGKTLGFLVGHTKDITSVACSQDGRQILSGSLDGTCRIWDAESCTELICLRGHECRIARVAYFLDEKRVISKSWDGTIRIWDVNTGDCSEVPRRNGGISSIAAGYSYWILSKGGETVVEDAGGAQAIGWFPAKLSHVTTHPSGRTWVGSVANHLYIITLEGGQESRR